VTDRLCRATHVIPDASGLLLLTALALLVVGLHAFANDLRESGELKIAERRPGERLITNRLRTAYHGYRRLEPRPKAIVFGALEGALWAATLLAVTVAFYFLQRSHPRVDGYPAAALLAAVIVRIGYGVVQFARWWRRDPPAMPSTTPQ
jgi:hypothetical protein